MNRIADHLKNSTISAAKKLKSGMDSGPDGDNVVLTPAEATILYRILTEIVGMKFE